MSKSMSDYVTAKEACTLLDIKRASLYSYTSRGLVRSVPSAKDRSRLYLRADVMRLRTRHDARRGHGAVAASALRWGEPVLDSAVTEITERGPVYRGHAAVDLAGAGVRFEQAAELLWSGTLPERVEDFLLPEGVCAALRRVKSKGDYFEAMSAVLLAIRRIDPDKHAPRVLDEGNRARLVLSALANVPFLVRGVVPARSNGSLARQVLLAFGRRVTDRSERALNAALVLLADHELSASAFSARVAASTGADLYSCVLAAVATCFGPLHGGECNRVELALEEMRRAQNSKRFVAERRAKAESIPGFTHRLYPEGDPRTALLLHHARELRAGSRTAPAFALVDAMCALRAEPPTVDFGLVVLARALKLPRGAATYLFSFARIAGWVAHVMEQRETNALLRPRARFKARAQAGEL